MAAEARTSHARRPWKQINSSPQCRRSQQSQASSGRFRKPPQLFLGRYQRRPARSIKAVFWCCCLLRSAGIRSNATKWLLMGSSSKPALAWQAWRLPSRLIKENCLMRTCWQTYRIRGFFWVGCYLDTCVLSPLRSSKRFTFSTQLFTFQVWKQQCKKA